MNRPLEGIRVLDLTQAYSGPFCTMNLADHGAEVIKIETPPYGDQTRGWGPMDNGFSGYYAYINRNKKGMTLNLKSEEGKQIFTELLKTRNCGQFSVNISKPGITKGQHWHNSKWGLFIVVAGHGLIRERNIHTGETVEFEVSGDKIEAVHMIPGWTHNIINLSETENLVTVMTCNEIFNPERPDTFFEPV